MSVTTELEALLSQLRPIDAPVSELVTDLISHYKLQGKKTYKKDVESRWENHLKPFFGTLRASEMTTDKQTTYRTERMDAGAAPATVNREMVILHRAFKQAAENEPPKISRVPKFQFFKEDNARKRFASQEEIDALRLAAKRGRNAPWLPAFLEIAIQFGWRRGEMMGLRVADINVADKTIRLHKTKNGDAREVPMNRAVSTLLLPLVVNRPTEEKVFPVSEIRYPWDRLCKNAGVTGLHIHDLRRTAARRLRAQGNDSSVIKKVCGWKTDSVFQRYCIVNQDDMREALRTTEKL